MSIDSILGICSAIVFTLPIIIILYGRLFINISLLAYVVYFLLSVIYTLVAEHVIDVDAGVRIKMAIINNYLDVPLMLLGMLLFCAEKWKQQMVQMALLLFVVYEVTILLNFQLQPVSSKYIMGPGIVLVLLFGFYFFINNIRSTIIQGKGIGKTLMIASVLFAYGSYLLVYIFFYIIKTSNRKDVFIIYYLTSIIFGLIMSAGLIWVRKRFKEIKEVKNTRRELGMFFNHYSQNA